MAAPSGLGQRVAAAAAAVSAIAAMACSIATEALYRY
jgi:hypothetical protein